MLHSDSGQHTVTYNEAVLKSNFYSLRRRKEAEIGKDITLRDIAEATDLSVVTVNKASRGQFDELRFSTVVKLCEYFGVKRIDDLVEFKPDPPQKQQ